MECFPLEGSRSWLAARARQETPQPSSATAPGGLHSLAVRWGCRGEGGERAWTGRVGADLAVQGISGEGSSHCSPRMSTGPWGVCPLSAEQRSSVSLMSPQTGNPRLTCTLRSAALSPPGCSCAPRPQPLSTRASSALASSHLFTSVSSSDLWVQGGRGSGLPWSQLCSTEPGLSLGFKKGVNEGVSKYTAIPWDSQYTHL